MVVIMLPKWYSEAEKELDDVIAQIANKQNLQYSFVNDSKSIETGKTLILNALVHIYEHSAGQFTQSELEDFKKIEEVMNKQDLKEKAKRIKKKGRKK